MKKNGLRKKNHHLLGAEHSQQKWTGINWLPKCWDFCNSSGTTRPRQGEVTTPAGLLTCSNINGTTTKDYYKQSRCRTSCCDTETKCPKTYEGGCGVQIERRHSKAYSCSEYANGTWPTPRGITEAFRLGCTRVEQDE